MERPIDRKRVQDFARKIFGFYTSGILTLLVGIGHRTGLFEALAQGPGGSDEIAKRAGLDERYVREWLAAMATGGVLEYDASSKTFTLPAEHALCLTGTSSRNLAPGSQFLPMLAARASRVAECFRAGGGVPYAEYRPDFTEGMDASWRLLYDGLLIKGFLPAAKGLPGRLAAGIRVADVGCGTGHAINLMAREYPGSTFVGYDLSEEAIARARAEARAMGLGNARFEALDATALPPEPKFDLITTFDSIHDQRDPAAVLRRIAAALAPDGIYLMVEPKASSNLEDNIGNPFAPYMYGISVLHCMTVSLAEGGLGLGTAWGEQTARRMLGEVGFREIEVVDAPGPQNSIYVCRP
ncbi:MAG: class I SAM-dependent methyltransferase [Candidatus Rokubacteria bacterium]|nr:class I SAM-dependent methyltransferase [Candidatus Rokubacteria bacterium]